MLEGRVKRGRNPGESPSTKRSNTADNTEGQIVEKSRSRSEVNVRTLSRYRAILPKPRTEKRTEELQDDVKDVPVPAKYGCANPKVSKLFAVNTLFERNL